MNFLIFSESLIKYFYFVDLRRYSATFGLVMITTINSKNIDLKRMKFKRNIFKKYYSE